MSENKTTIKAGEGYDRPWISSEGDVDEQREFLLKAFNLEDKGYSLAQVSIEASIVYQALAQWANDQEVEIVKRVKAELGATEVTPSDKSKDDQEAPKAKAGTKTRKTRAKPKAKSPDFAEPTDVSDSIEAKIEGVKSKDALAKLYLKHRDSGDWTDEHTALASAKKEKEGWV